MNKRLFHVSEESDISEFVPRYRKNPLLEGDAVWAVDEDHLMNYLFPRECPRLTFFADANTTPEDVQRFFSVTEARHVVVIEAAWLSRLVNQKVYLYEFDNSNFELIDEIAGYHISRQIERPISVRACDNLVEELISRDVEIRVLEHLWDLREEIIHSTLAFSLIRMKNAAPPAKGAEAYFPMA